MAGKPVRCEYRGRDRYGRTRGAALVSCGMVWAFTRYSSDYISQESAIGGRPACPRTTV